jgi:hypothetical protein
MTLDRRIVAIAGPLAILSGVICAAVPATLGEHVGISATPSGLTDMRAVYGGMQIGLGAFLLWCRSDPARTLPGLLALGLALGGVALLRIVGLLVDQEPNAVHAANLALEAGTAALVWFAISRRRAAAAPA